MTSILNEDHRHYLLLNAVKDLHNTDYRNMCLGIQILMGAVSRKVTMNRSLLKRFSDAFRSAVDEFKRKETVVPVTPI